MQFILETVFHAQKHRYRYSYLVVVLGYCLLVLYDKQDGQD